MFCRFCGEQIKDDSVYCPKCGKPIADSHSIAKRLENRPQRIPAKARIAIICLSVAIVILICLISILQQQKFQMQEASRMTVETLNAKIEEQTKAIQMKDSSIAALEKAKLNYDFIIRKLKSDNIGSPPDNFKTDKSVIVVKKSDKNQKVKLTTTFSGKGSVQVDYSSLNGTVWNPDVAIFDFDEESWKNSTTLTVHPYKAGVAIAKFSNTVNDLSFSVLIIVTD